MTGKKEEGNKSGRSSEGEWKSTHSQWENMSGETGSSNSIQHSGGYSVKYRSLDTVTSGEGLCLAGAIF